MKRVLLFFLLLTPAHASSVTVFVAPDSSFTVLEGFIASANSSLVINAYTFEHLAIAGALAEAKERGVAVTVLAEARPVGGVSKEGHAALCTLADAGIPVLLHTNKQLVHAKYAIRDNSSSLIVTENFGPTGYPETGKGNRGWGAVIHDEAFAKELAAIFASDIKDAQPYTCTQAIAEQKQAQPYTPRFQPRTFEDQRVRLVVAPDATKPIVDLLNARTLYIEQFYIDPQWGSAKNPFLEAALASARNNASVKLLLDATWYNTAEGDNDEVVASVNGIAAAEQLDLEARLADPTRLGIEKIHAKGVVADDAVFISSVNWNEASPTKNREIGVIIEGGAASYFRDAFLYDWNGGKDVSENAPVTGKAAERGNGMTVALAIALIVLLVLVIFILKARKK